MTFYCHVAAEMAVANINIAVDGVDGAADIAGFAILYRTVAEAQ